jgi:hypothetical protein
MTIWRLAGIPRRCDFAAAVIVLGLLSGCDGQADLDAALRDFVTGLARSGVAAFLL